MFMGMTFYEIAVLFLAYSFIGWVIEVIFHAVTLGKIINRGFLCGPVCPVYGCGMLAVLWMIHGVSGLTQTEPNAVIIFFCSMILATLIELFAGWALDRLFHMRWWDYSDMPYNLHGYICLKFSLYWGLGGLLVVDIAHPTVRSLTVEMIPEGIEIWILAGFYLIFIADALVTTAAIGGLNKRLREIDEIRGILRMPSDRITDSIAGGSIKTAAAIGRTRVQAALAEAELKAQIKETRQEILDTTGEIKGRIADTTEEIREEFVETKEKLSEKVVSYETRLEELFDKVTTRNIISRRLLNAFPNVRHLEYGEILKDIKNRMR